MLPSRNPFLLLKDLDILTSDQFEELREAIIAQLEYLGDGILNSKFLPEQIAEIKFWITEFNGKKLKIENELAILNKKIESVHDSQD